MTALAYQNSSVDRFDGRSLRGASVALTTAWGKLNLWARRATLSVVGAVFAFAFGAAAAEVVRLPPEMNDPPSASDEMTVQGELASIASARAYALDNPPTYAAPPPPMPRAEPDETLQAGDAGPKATPTRDDDGADPLTIDKTTPASGRPDPGANEPGPTD